MNLENQLQYNTCIDNARMGLNLRLLPQIQPHARIMKNNEKAVLRPFVKNVNK